MKKSRFLFYFLISILVSLVDVMSDFDEEPIEETIFFAVMTLPSVLMFTYVVYNLRKWLVALPWYKGLVGQRDRKRGVWSVLILVKSMAIAILTKWLSMTILPEFHGNRPFFDFIFWGMFIGVFCVVVFVYAFEAFIEVESEKQRFQIHLKNIENEKLVAKYLNLKNQLNPHFLFNSFNSLSGLINLDPKKADYFLSELSNVYRYTLDQSDEIVVPLEREIGLIRSYVALQRIRFGDSLRVEYSVPSDDLKKMLPPMTLELLVENAIKHNIVEKDNPLDIVIRALGNYVVVSNNYQPRTDSGPHGDSTKLGLKNLKNQYSMIHTEEPRFDIRNGKYVAIIPLIEPN